MIFLVLVCFFIYLKVVMSKKIAYFAIRKH
nr:MAG TPA: hypothetical protein [Caudoviricetes sp.]